MVEAARARRAGLVLLPVALLAAAGWALGRELHGFHFRDLERGLAALPRASVGAAVAATALDYLLLSAYDLLALAWVGRRLPTARVVFTSFIAYAFGNNVGLSLLSSGSVRVPCVGWRGRCACSACTARTSTTASARGCATFPG